MNETRPFATGSINGVDAVFLVDSGAFFSMLTYESAEKYKLKLGMLPVGMQIRGVGGAARAQLAIVKDFTLTGFSGSRVIHNVEFIVSGNSDPTSGAAGLIGQNLIGGADTEYDLANGFIRLFRAKDCSDRSMAYWHGTTDVAVVDIESRTALAPHIIGTSLLNGKKIRVVFDSGASHSVLTLKAAARAGIKPDQENVSAAGLSSGIGKKIIETSTARFDELDLGGEKIKNARLQLGDLEIGNGADMLLGADFFLSHRIYVAAKQRKIYFTYNGGRVFDLGVDQQRKDVVAATSSGPSDIAASKTKEERDASREASMDAATFRRRGAASAGRRDFASAIADFDQAIKLDPADPENYYQRGMARRQERQGMPAMSDFDQVLKIKPDHIPALTERGMLRLAMNNESGARADFDLIDTLAPNDPSLSYRIAEIYVAMRHFDEAINRIDRWIVAYPKDDRLAMALNGRCWSRAMIGKNLDLALADCNAAVKKGLSNSSVFDNRGMVFLQLGDFDKSISDFNTSLKRQPKGSFALYGLGVAERKKGLQAEGDKNIQAAVAITPTIPEFFKRLNLTP